MFNNVGLDIFIGLVFIYLLYSLLATVIAEIIATQLGIRARNLREAVDRMVSDNVPMNGFERFIDSLNLMKCPNNERINKFYDNPEIKYLGSTGIFQNPSSFKAETFSRTLLYELNGSGNLSKSKIETELQKLTNGQTEDINPKLKLKPEENNQITAGHIDSPIAGPIEPPKTRRFNISKYSITVSKTENPLRKPIEENTAIKGVSHKEAKTLDPQSAQFVLSLLHYSYGDLDKFKLHLEAWFDRTMDQATEWYKRKIQVILIVLGFFMAWIFNAGSFTILNKLSNDKDAREKLVEMASAHLQNNRSSNVTNLTPEEKKSLNQIEKKLQDDVNNANNILGLGSWLPDSLKISYDPLLDKRVYTPSIDEALLKEEYLGSKYNNSKIYFRSFPNKLKAFGSLFYIHFWGYFITALAISLGSPFWFDLLNKLMQLRTSIKVPTNSTENKDDSVSPLNRVG